MLKCEDPRTRSQVGRMSHLELQPHDTETGDLRSRLARQSNRINEVWVGLRAPASLNKVE